MKINLIVACDLNGAIGNDDKLLWKIPEDMARFKQLTSGHGVLMGRKTYESIGRPLENRVNVVVSNSMDTKEYVSIQHDIQSGIDFAKNLGLKQLWVIGGGTIYEEFINNEKFNKQLDCIELTLVNTNCSKHDVSISLSKLINPHNFTQTKSVLSETKHGLQFEFKTYTRLKNRK